MERRTGSVIRRTAICLALVTVFAPMVWAEQAPPFDALSWQFGAGAGYGIGVLGDYVGYGYTGTVGAMLRPSEEFPEAAFVLSGGYILYPGTQDSSGDFGILTGALDFKFTPSYDAASQFYLLAGIGYAHVSLRNAASGQVLVAKKNSEGCPLAEAGIGVKYDNRSGPDYLIEVKATNAFSSQFGDYRWVTLTLGVSL